MAIEFARIEMLSRSKGASALATAAARSGTRLVDPRLGKVFDHTDRAAEIAHSEILLPERAPENLRDRGTLWLSIEEAEDRSTRRSTAQLAKDILIALPAELEDPKEQVALARDFALWQFVEQGIAVDLNVKLSDPDNPHAHMMIPMRLINENGIGNKLHHHSEPFFFGYRIPNKEQLCDRWAKFQSAWLQGRGIDVEVETNDGDRPAEPHLGVARQMKAGEQRTLLGDAKRRA